jgi:Protein of unknown function (DUF2510)
MATIESQVAGRHGDPTERPEERFFEGLVSDPAKSGASETVDALREGAAGCFPAPHGSPLAVDEPPETRAGSAGWYPDPTEFHDLRFFDGKQWTDQRTRILPTEPDRPSASPG